MARMCYTPEAGRADQGVSEGGRARVQMKEEPFDPSKIRKLDFSQFHALDHWPWQCRRRSQEWAATSSDGKGMYGGAWVHLKYAWQYRRRDEVVGWLRKPLCRRGRHAWIEWRDRLGTKGESCRYCLVNREKT